MRTLLFLAFFCFAGLAACKKDDTIQTPSAARADVLVANKWRMERITRADDGTVVPVNQLGVSALALNFIDIQFTEANIARAIDRNTKQIINAGSWKLTQDYQGLDVDVTGFKGIFPIIELSRTKLILRQNTTINNVKTDVNLEFVPSV
ncbi:hypothetical protein J2I47_20895 [Fibrella sp. HMF5335]|uniref:Lipocalin-like domain-containing protein n=1 Tax=Fibrella rubiginis TaxID=2817060 RepID=A0A939K524_9BACT|nr:hypothetical protein [Fibrella rubiginis]MBO0939024.1 hypothetical protein [Fibrella rubiginis]